MNLLTLNGLHMLLELYRQDKELPEGWAADATEYLRIKRWAVDKFGRDWDKEQLREAELIIWILHRRGKP